MKLMNVEIEVEVEVEIEVEVGCLMEIPRVDM